MDLELGGKCAIVTGGAKGIGLAVVETLAAEGMSVVMIDRDAEEGQREVERLVESDRDVTFLACDLTDRAALAATAVRALEVLGGLHVLVNNAGIQEYGTVVDTPAAVWQRVLAVNLTSTFLMSRACLPSLLAAGGAAIVNLSSVQAFAAQRGVAAYAASKGGLVSLTKSMAVDFAPTVRVNCVCPGSVDTPMLRSAAALFADDPDEAARDWGDMHLMRRLAEPAEVADMVAFLASPRAGFTTGSAFFVDGGLLTAQQASAS